MKTVDNIHHVIELGQIARMSLYELTNLKEGSRWEGFSEPWKLSSFDPLDQDKALELFKRVAWGVEPREVDFAMRVAPEVLLRWLLGGGSLSSLQYMVNSVGPGGVAGILRGDFEVKSRYVMDMRGSLLSFVLHHQVVLLQSRLDQSAGRISDEEYSLREVELNKFKTKLATLLGLTQGSAVEQGEATGTVSSEDPPDRLEKALDRLEKAMGFL